MSLIASQIIDAAHQPLQTNERAAAIPTRSSRSPALRPIFVRLNKVQDVFAVSDDQVRIWERKKMLTIFKRGRMSFVRTEDLTNVIEGVHPQPVGQVVG